MLTCAGIRPLDWETLLYQLPQILNLLQLPALKALQSTSNNLCSQMHRFITAIHTDSRHTVSQLIARKWPRLRQLHLRTPLHPDDISRLSACTWQHVVFLDFSKSPLTWSALEVLGKGCWECLQHLNLSGTSLCGERMAEVCCGRWSGLQTLLLKDCSLNSKSIRYMRAACWPALQHLQLLGNQLSTADFARLCTAQWPLLNRVDLACVFLDSIIFDPADSDEDAFSKTDPSYMADLIHACGLESRN